MNERIPNQVMTVAEIEKQFNNEWILVEDPILDEDRQVVGGKVLWHSKSKEEIYRKDHELRPRSAAYLFTGSTPEYVAINL